MRPSNSERVLDLEKCLCRRVRNGPLVREAKQPKDTGRRRGLVVKVFYQGCVGCMSPHHQPYTERLDLQKMMEFTIMSCSSGVAVGSNLEVFFLSFKKQLL